LCTNEIRWRRRRRTSDRRVFIWYEAGSRGISRRILKVGSGRATTTYLIGALSSSLNLRPNRLSHRSVCLLIIGLFCKRALWKRPYSAKELSHKLLCLSLARINTSLFCVCWCVFLFGGCKGAWGWDKVRCRRDELSGLLCKRDAIFKCRNSFAKRVEAIYCCHSWVSRMHGPCVPVWLFYTPPGAIVPLRARCRSCV